MKIYYQNGEYFDAKTYIDSILNYKELYPNADFRLIYHYAGFIYRRLGETANAQMYYAWSEKYCDPPVENPYHLFHNFNSRGNLYVDMGDFFRASSFLEQALKYLSLVKEKDQYYFQRLSAILQNLGINSYNSGDLQNARNRFITALEISLDHRFSDISFIYFNLGKISDRLKEFSSAEEYYILAIETQLNGSNVNHSDLADIYVEYGEMLMLTKNYEKSLEYMELALAIFVENYGVYSIYTSACLQITGDIYLAMDSCHSALEYYQKALQSIHPGFTSEEFSDNPPFEGSLLDIRYMEILSKKARALSQYALASIEKSMQKDLWEQSITTTRLAINVKEKIRNSYPSQESIFFLAEHEKEIYLNGVNAAYELYLLKGDPNSNKIAFGFASEWKAAELLRNINSREAMSNENVNDSLNTALIEYEHRISQYNQFIIQENQKEMPDSGSLLSWKNKLFETSRSYENSLEIAKKQDWYQRMHRKPAPANVEKLQKQLSGNQSIIEYVLSQQESEGLQQLFTFVITKKDFKILRQNVNDVFYADLDYYYKQLETFPNREINFASFDTIRNSLYNLYAYLIKPVEEFLSGTELFIIPDDKLNILPFESLISRKSNEEVINFSGFAYLIYQYNISYAYSANLLFSEKKFKTRSVSLNAFAPATGNLFALEAKGLYGSKMELEYISGLFKGNYFYGKEASLANFYNIISDPGIIHFALHSNRERDFKSGGYLELYKTSKDSLDGKLWGHEISFLEIKSPMVCLSGCNSGLGIINASEGVLSLTRNFMEAGATAVVHSLWEVNDFTAFDLIADFYSDLSRGSKKNIALQQAKLNFLEDASPSLHHPFYWAGYQLVGSIAPVKTRFPWQPLMLLLFLGLALLYFLRRRISRRSLPDGP